jgi:outer membrane receptor protein involved in Fe transport
MARGSKNIRARLLCGAAVASLTLWASAASAQDAPEINIPPQRLATALYAFAGQSGHQVMFAPEIAGTKMTRGVTGVTDQQEALRRLLEGTELAFLQQGDTFLIVRASDPQSGSAAGDGAGTVEALIVTAQKREEEIQDVPIAISAFTQKTLDEQKIEGGFDLLKGVPNVAFSKTNFTGYNFQIRGIGTQAISATTDPAVAVSFNNTTLIVNRLFEQEYVDIERVEVLRGPQGTLYGRNATAGVINVISAKPVMGDFFGEVKVEGGNFNAKRLRAHVNVPLGDQFAIRAAFASTKRDGYGYNEYDGSDVDDRDLWTSRVTLGWEPTSYFRANLLWERFHENDRRVRTSKQLCHRDAGPTEPILGRYGDAVDPQASFFYSALSQGCKAGSLYTPEAFGTPNGASLPYVSALYWGSYYGSFLGALTGVNEAYGLGGNPFIGNPDVCPELRNGNSFNGGFHLNPVDVCNPDIYRGRMQSSDLRTISSQLQPKYRADADIFDLTFDFDLTDSLTLTSQTVYSDDEYYATQDYNRFQAFPIWSPSNEACGLIGKYTNCAEHGTFAGGFYADLSPRPENSTAPITAGGIVCDPQLGCSDTLLIQDLSRSKSKQFNQEFRLVSSYEGAWNFSLGANFTKFETQNDYFVFANGFTHLLNFFPFQFHNSQCVLTSSPESIASRQFDGDFCRYVDPNPLESINGEGHNYFRSDNPYKLTSAAVFGELYWQITPTVQLTTGMRFTWDRKVFTPVPSQLFLADYREATFVQEGEGPEGCWEIITTCPLAGTGVGGRGSPASPDIVQDWREPTGRLVLDWKPDLAFTDDSMVYASLSHGYKGGGANPPSVAPPSKFFFDKASGGTPEVFKPEYVNAYEVGTKNTLLSGALVLNASAFYYDYKDYQVSKIIDRRAVNENFDAKIWGLELESIFAPTRNLRFNAAIGYLQTRIADGEQSIDIMDRTDGGHRFFANPNGDFPEGFDEWIVIQPWITAASNCIVPRALMAANLMGSTQNFINAYCPTGNVAGGNTSFLGTSYFDENGNYVPMGGGNQKNYDAAVDAPNGGAGFYKDLGGNELPNAPRWTVSLGAQYRIALPAGWDATARVDYYWQDKSFARVYNMPDYDRLRAWTNTNFSLWFEQPDWNIKAEIYVKNAFDETPITGAFLNSDDSGLTTNVFTLDPRLVGVSLTKDF